MDKANAPESGVDLTKLKAGDTVEFRCGGKAVVEKCVMFPDIENVVNITFKGDPTCRGYHQHGDYHYPRKSVIDIINIIPKPFDWKDVKPGMAFTQKCGSSRKIVWIVGKAWAVPFSENDGHCFIVTDDSEMGCSDSIHFAFTVGHDLTRAPAHDITDMTGGAE